MKRAAVITLLLIALFSLWYYARNPLTTTATIRNASFIVDVAVTPKEKEVGLGGRRSLDAHRGMLFVYDHKERYPFWMRNMRFPIDIIWIADKTVVDITKNVPVSDLPVESLPIYHPSVPVDMVLEVNAGLCNAHGISVGDSVTIKN